MSVFKFGRKLKLPSVIQIKHQILLSWLADQTAKEAAELNTWTEPMKSSGDMKTVADK